MFSTFRYTLVSLLRSSDVMVWALVFPLVLVCMFMTMFSSIDQEESYDEAIPLVVVQPDESADGRAFQTFLEAIGTVDGEDAAEGSAGASNGADHNAAGTNASDGSSLLSITYADNSKEAEELVLKSGGEGADESPYVGYVQLIDGSPQFQVMPPESSQSALGSLDASIVLLALEQYEANATMVKSLVKDDPQVLADPAVQEQLFEPIQATQRVQLTHSKPSESARFYFALMGMAALFGGLISQEAMKRLNPRASALGARRAEGALGNTQTVLATLLACWVLCWACLLVTYCFICFIAQVDFGGRDLLCILTVGVSSLLGLSLGCAVSALPPTTFNASGGIITGIVCATSLLAGLYGTPCMELADYLAVHAPIVQILNPAYQVAQSFYSIVSFDSLLPWAEHIGIMLVMVAVLLLLSAQTLKRRRYASL